MGEHGRRRQADDRDQGAELAVRRWVTRTSAATAAAAPMTRAPMRPMIAEPSSHDTISSPCATATAMTAAREP